MSRFGSGTPFRPRGQGVPQAGHLDRGPQSLLHRVLAARGRRARRHRGGHRVAPRPGNRCHERRTDRRRGVLLARGVRHAERPLAGGRSGGLDHQLVPVRGAAAERDPRLPARHRGGLRLGVVDGGAAERGLGPPGAAPRRRGRVQGESDGAPARLGRHHRQRASGRGPPVGAARLALFVAGGGVPQLERLPARAGDFPEVPSPRRRPRRNRRSTRCPSRPPRRTGPSRGSPSPAGCRSAGGGPAPPLAP